VAWRRSRSRVATGAPCREESRADAGSHVGGAIALLHAPWTGPRITPRCAQRPSPHPAAAPTPPPRLPPPSAYAVPPPPSEIRGHTARGGDAANARRRQAAIGRDQRRARIVEDERPIAAGGASRSSCRASRGLVGRVCFLTSLHDPRTRGRSGWGAYAGSPIAQRADVTTIGRRLARHPSGNIGSCWNLTAPEQQAITEPTRR
jgi:hypothetical protein